MEPTQAQYDTTFQTYRNMDIQINVMDFDFNLLDEISGLATSVSINIDSDSDIRRTANINMIVRSDYTRTGSYGASLQSHDMYWQAGNLYWFDKYIQIYIGIEDFHTQEQVWVNQGIYLLNAPSIQYDATTNELSFEAVDLMSKMTGMRNGYLEGVEYVVPADSVITNAIENALIEAGFKKYILEEPPTPTVPYDIRIDIGSTVYDLISELRDINANWEVFFDEDGVFHFQQIPSGNIHNPNTGNDEMLEPVLHTDEINRLLLNYSLDTDFEEVKNYIEVCGKMQEPYGMLEFDDVDSQGMVYAKMPESWDTVMNDPDAEGYYMFGIGVEIDDNTTTPIVRNVPLIGFRIEWDNESIPVDIEEDLQPRYSNQYYVLRMKKEKNVVSSFTAEYSGYMQSYGVAWESNPDSPFYVGDALTYTTLGNKQEHIEPTEVIMYQNPQWDFDTVELQTISGVYRELYADLTPIWQTIINYNDPTRIFTVPLYIPKGAIGEWTIWGLRLEIDRLFPIPQVTKPGTYITLDIDDMIYALRLSLSEGILGVAYLPIGAEHLGSSTDDLNPPRFTNQIRYVCSGEEYDNIYSNDLALQRARYEVYLRSRLHDSLTLEIVPIYWLGVNEVIEFTPPNELNENESEDGTYWLVKSISSDYSVSGTQTITAMRYYPLYPSV